MHWASALHEHNDFIAARALRSPCCFLHEGSREGRLEGCRAAFSALQRVP